MSAPATRVLTINPGSSSLKAALYDFGAAERRMALAEAERIGLPDSRLRLTDDAGRPIQDDAADLPDHATAMRHVLAWLRADRADQGLRAVGYRVVHGGARYNEPQTLTQAVLADIARLEPIDPDHVPQTLAIMRLVVDAYPSVRHVACFDTAFHRTMPRVARLYALPRRLTDAGLVRYGFHGLSCEYIVEQLRRIDAAAAGGRVIVAHLGSGASLTAIRGGRSVDTTMGFSPTGGLMMATRSGDLDPGVLLYLAQSWQFDEAGLNELVNRQAGLLAVSGVSHDMRDLLEREARDPRAAEAIELFCYVARKFLGALVAVLGGLDTLVFTAGIGEHAPAVRQRICTGFEYLGLAVEERRNLENAAIISPPDSRVVVRVVKTDEDLTIARHTHHLTRNASDSA